MIFDLPRKLSPYWDYLLVKMDREQDSNFQSIKMGIDRTYPH